MTHAVPSLSAAEQEAVDQEVLALLARQGRRVPYPVGLTAVVIAAMAWSSQTTHWPWVWLCVVLAVLALRWWRLGRLPTQTEWPLSNRLRQAAGLSLLNGVVFSASVLFVPDFSEYQRMVQTLLVLGLCAGAVATTAGYAPVFLSFLVPVALSNSLMWFGGALAGSHAWVDWILGGLILAFAWVLAGLARDAYRVFCESMQIRFQQLQTNQRLMLALGQAESAMQARTRFLAAASHDLRQPMHTLSLFGSALESKPLDAESRTIARHMNQAVQSLASQMDALLDMSKLDAQVVPVSNQVIRLDVWLARLQTEWQVAAERKGLALGVHCPPTAMVESDPVLLERLVRNLVDNAIKYTSQGRVDVVVLPGDEVWDIEVRDTGCGIAEAEQARVFEEFYQINNPERDRSKGLGLGLSIVARLVDLLDANLHLSSAPQQGSVFTLSVNAGQAPLEVMAESMDALGVPLQGIKVLVIDNEEPVREAMQSLLQAQGCEVLLAGDIRGGMLHLLKSRPDIALVDLRLRGHEDGIAAIRSFRHTLPAMPAILVSGDTGPERLQEAHRAGLTLLHKPVLAADLLAAIRGALHAASVRGLASDAAQPQAQTHTEKQTVPGEPHEPNNRVQDHALTRT
jgi:signal transduction histidine kinase/DNA-binding NarL/FixJ family response regulator